MQLECTASSDVPTVRVRLAAVPEARTHALALTLARKRTRMRALTRTLTQVRLAHVAFTFASTTFKRAIKTRCVCVCVADCACWWALVLSEPLFSALVLASQRDVLLMTHRCCRLPGDCAVLCCKC